MDPGWGRLPPSAAPRTLPAGDSRPALPWRLQPCPAGLVEQISEPRDFGAGLQLPLNGIGGRRILQPPLLKTFQCLSKVPFKKSLSLRACVPWDCASAPNRVEEVLPPNPQRKGGDLERPAWSDPGAPLTRVRWMPWAAEVRFSLSNPGGLRRVWHSRSQMPCCNLGHFELQTLGSGLASSGSWASFRWHGQGPPQGCLLVTLLRFRHRGLDPSPT